MLRNVKRIVLYIASELEAQVVPPGGRAPMRRLYLKCLGMKLPQVFFVGRRPTIRYGGNMNVGERCDLGDNTTLTAHAPIRIGDDFTGASGLHIDSGTHDVDTFEPHVAEIVIGDRVWCGVRVTILSGVHIGNDCVIGAGAVVTKSIPDNSLAVGVPAKVVRSIRSQPVKVWSHFGNGNR